MKLAPSLLAANFTRLAEEIKSVEACGIDLLHIDVMDGHFVPNITMGPDTVKAIRKVTNSTLDVHLMIEDADAFIGAFAEAGADMISVHVEACRHLHRTIGLIKSYGIKAGVVLNPGTPVSSIKPILNDIDFVLLMTVNPGFGGQSFIESVIPKIVETKEMINTACRSIAIEVDGGINDKTIKQCYDAGASLFVAGSAIFNQSDRKAAIDQLLLEGV